MKITFRAEIIPDKNREERTFKIEKILSNGRVVLYNFTGEHRKSEFKIIRIS